MSERKEGGTIGRGRGGDREKRQRERELTESPQSWGSNE